MTAIQINASNWAIQRAAQVLPEHVMPTFKAATPDVQVLCIALFAKLADDQRMRDAAMEIHSRLI